ncbi:hypothetical protein RN50_01043 [Microbacterium foliorum]|uniref:Nitroreductase domain-containing protein n=1 Tax=Microbacterium foliorum TaxID=104336 RepID=A0A0F0KS69_9MICO|nr:hypothetical protein RN50_01043 [Microbacterium foliorum]
MRSFGSSLVTDEQMVELIRLSCGTADAPGVAQAGGVGGVKVHAMLSRQDGVTESFVYEADNGVLVPASVGEGTLLRCVDTSDVNRVPALIVLAIDLVARRGYRNAYDLSLIEVGQVYQRLEDNARHLGLRVCAMGAVAGAASLHDTMTSPVLGVVIGVPEESKK